MQEDLVLASSAAGAEILKLVEAGFETLVEAGYQPEVAYFECLHELKFIVDLMHRTGISGMRARISETAKWGDVSVGPQIIDHTVKQQMRETLLKIQTGKFARDWLRAVRSRACPPGPRRGR